MNKNYRKIGYKHFSNSLYRCSTILKSFLRKLSLSNKINRFKTDKRKISPGRIAVAAFYINLEMYIKHVKPTSRIKNFKNSPNFKFTVTVRIWFTLIHLKYVTVGLNILWFLFYSKFFGKIKNLPWFLSFVSNKNSNKTWNLTFWKI